MLTNLRRPKIGPYPFIYKNLTSTLPLFMRERSLMDGSFGILSYLSWKFFLERIRKFCVLKVQCGRISTQLTSYLLK